MNLFVANINREVNEDSLKSLFAEVGEVTSVRIAINDVTGQSKGFGFVEMPNEKSATDAIKKLSNTYRFGKTLVVSKSRP